MTANYEERISNEEYAVGEVIDFFDLVEAAVSEDDGPIALCAEDSFNPFDYTSVKYGANLSQKFLNDESRIVRLDGEQRVLSNDAVEELKSVFGFFFNHNSPFNGNVILKCKRPDNEHGNKKPGRMYCVSRKETISEIETMSEKVSPDLTYYVTANLFCGSKNRMEKLRNLVNIVVDVDCHADKSNVTPEQMYDLLMDKFMELEVPVQNMCVFTGRGLQFWWHFVGGYAKNVNREYAYRAAKAYLVGVVNRALKDLDDNSRAGWNIDFGASNNDSGLFRVPFGKNYHTGKCSYCYLLHQHTYNVFGMAERAYAKKYAKRRSVNSQERKSAVVKKPAQLHIAPGFGSPQMAWRLDKLLDFANAHNWDFIGIRHNFLLICGMTLQAMNPGMLEEKLQAINANLMNPKDSYEVKQIIKCCRKKLLFFTNKTIGKKLKMTKSEFASFTAGGDVTMGHCWSKNNCVAQWLASKISGIDVRIPNRTRDSVNRYRKELTNLRNLLISKYSRQGMSLSAISHALTEDSEKYPLYYLVSADEKKKDTRKHPLLATKRTIWNHRNDFTCLSDAELEDAINASQTKITQMQTRRHPVHVEKPKPVHLCACLQNPFASITIPSRTECDPNSSDNLAERYTYAYLLLVTGKIFSVRIKKWVIYRPYNPAILSYQIAKENEEFNSILEQEKNCEQVPPATDSELDAMYYEDAASNADLDMISEDDWNDANLSFLPETDKPVGEYAVMPDGSRVPISNFLANSNPKVFGRFQRNDAKNIA